MNWTVAQAGEGPLPLKRKKNWRKKEGEVEKERKKRKKKGEKKEKRQEKRREREYNSRNPLKIRQFYKIRAFYIDIFPEIFSTRNLKKLYENQFKSLMRIRNF